MPKFLVGLLLCVPDVLQAATSMEALEFALGSFGHIRGATVEYRVTSTLRVGKGKPSKKEQTFRLQYELGDLVFKMLELRDLDSGKVLMRLDEGRAPVSIEGVRVPFREGLRWPGRASSLMLPAGLGRITPLPARFVITEAATNTFLAGPPGKRPLYRFRVDPDRRVVVKLDLLGTEESLTKSYTYDDYELHSGILFPKKIITEAEFGGNSSRIVTEFSLVELSEEDGAIEE